MRILGVEWSGVSIVAGCALALTAQTTAGQAPTSKSGANNTSNVQIGEHLATGSLPRMTKAVEDSWSVRRKLTHCLQDKAMTLAATTQDPVPEIVSATMGACMGQDGMSEERQANLGRILGMLARMERGRHLALATAQ